VPGVCKGLHRRDGTRGVVLAANLPQGETGYSTAFPVASLRGAAFDTALEQSIGKAIADEMTASKNTLLHAPGVDVLRHPAWGRSQEAYGEDPYLVGRLGTAFTEGVQQYIPACAQHLAGNTIENARQTDTSLMDEQTLHEIYGRPFEMVIQDGGVACVMAAYNLLQVTDSPTDTSAIKCTQNTELLTDLLRGTFGFTGFVVSDFFGMPGDFASCATPPATQTRYAGMAVNAGLDMELPLRDNFSQLPNDVQGGVLLESQLETSATRIVTQEIRFNVLTGPGLDTAPATRQDPVTGNIVSNELNVALARQAATEGMVLLKNSAHTLPIPTTAKTVAVIGATVPIILSATEIANGQVDFVTNQVTGGPPTLLTGDFGSSRVYPDPALSVGPLAGIQKIAAARGITVVSGSSAAAAAGADFVVVMAGLTPEDEGEDYTTASDRTSFSLDDKLVHRENMPAVQDPLIASVAALGKPMVVVLEGGSVIDMPWLSQVPAVVMAWYSGQQGGAALADLLFGQTNFSGKLPITWPNALAGPCTGSCPGPGSAACLGQPACTCPACFGDEPLFSAGPAHTTPLDYYFGYRYYDNAHIQPLFPFGYGLSYTTYTYGALALSKATATAADTVSVTVPVTNTGAVDGDEVSFAFVSYPNTKRTGHSAVKELKGFVRTHVPAHSTAQVTLPLRIADLKYWDTPSGRWVLESGAINVLVGTSSDKLLSSVTLTVH
jgi:beta-glucosidase